MKGKVYIYFLKELRGPFEIWELKLLASKYRDFHVYLGGGKWIAYKKWSKSRCSIVDLSPPFSPPEKLESFRVKCLRYIKRNIMRDHH